MRFEIVRTEAPSTNDRNEWVWTELIILAVLMTSGLVAGEPVRNALIVIGIAWVILTTVIYKRSCRCRWRYMGLSWKNSLTTWKLITWALLCAALIFYIDLVLEDGWQNFTRFPIAQIGYLPGCLLQEFLLGPYVAIRLLHTLKTESAVAKISALFFCLFHLPNPVLMAVSLLGGWVSVQVFLRFRNYYTLAVCHWIIGAALAAVLPPWFMTVGRGFWPHIKTLLSSILGS